MKDRFDGSQRVRTDDDSRRHFRETKDNRGQRAEDRDRDRREQQRTFSDFRGRIMLTKDTGRQKKPGEVK